MLPQKGVCHVINAGASLKGSAASIALAEKYEYFHAAAGIHPEVGFGLSEDWQEQHLGALRDLLETLGRAGEGTPAPGEDAPLSHRPWWEE